MRAPPARSLPAGSAEGASPGLPSGLRPVRPAGPMGWGGEARPGAAPAGPGGTVG